jgi:hypothetical protein
LVSFSVRPELFVPVVVLGNVRLIGETVIAGCGGAAAEPFRDTAVDPAFVWICSVATREPTAVGRKLTETEQALPADSATLQVLLAMKSAAFAPLTVTPETCRVPPPEFLSVMALAAVAIPTGVLEKLREEGETDSFGTVCAKAEPDSTKAAILNPRPERSD